MSLSRFWQPLYVEWSARGESYETLLQRLQKNESTTLSRILNATESAWNRLRTSHVTGIERWAVQRLRSLLGEPLVMDEYDGYAPSRDLSMAQLADEFKRTRAETYALVHELQNRGISLSQTVKHNEFGDLSVGGWLAYISSHTGRETYFLVQKPRNKAERATNS